MGIGTLDEHRFAARTGIYRYYALDEVPPAREFAYCVQCKRPYKMAPGEDEFAEPPLCSQRCAEAWSK